MAVYRVITCVLVLAMLSGVSLCATDRELTQKYRFSKVLDQGGNYKLYWSFSRRNETVNFAVRVRTTGWVGFGLSPNGQMVNSDVIVGWVDNNGQAHMHDRHTTCRCTPIIDSQQDWYLINGEEEGGYTTLEFTRYFTTCDENDLEIKAETQRVIWSYNNNDPVNSVPSYHQHRGSKSLNLIGGLENKRSVPSDTGSFSVRNSNLSVPSRDTTYWCSNHLLYDVTRVWNEEIYIYKARPIITPKNIAYVHHMMIFLCPTYSNIEDDGICADLTTNFFGCFGGQVLGAWAVGGEEFIFPEDVAFPLYVGEDEERPYKLLLEMHYDRTPAGGIVDSSGMEFFYTRQKPRHLAGTIGMSMGTSPVMVIPPNAERFSYQATCSSSCTDKHLPDDGITIFASFLHSHLIGRAMTVKHYRNTSQCNAVEELEPIDQNLSYDFDFQGDTITVLCHYDSRKRSSVTLGGESTREEMCQALLLYYPKIELATCGSIPDANTAHRRFFDKYYYGEKQHVDAAVDALFALSHERIAAAFNHIKWNDSAIADLQEAINDATVEWEYCTINRNTHPSQGNYTLEQKFAPNCSYKAADECTGYKPSSCCERLSTNILPKEGVATMATSISGAESASATVITTLVLIVTVVLTSLI